MLTKLRMFDKFRCNGCCEPQAGLTCVQHFDRDSSACSGCALTTAALGGPG